MITHGEKVTRTIYTYEFLVCKDSQSTSLEIPLGFPLCVKTPNRLIWKVLWDFRS